MTDNITTKEKKKTKREDSNKEKKSFLPVLPPVVSVGVTTKN